MKSVTGENIKVMAEEEDLEIVCIEVDGSWKLELKHPDLQRGHELQTTEDYGKHSYFNHTCFLSISGFSLGVDTLPNLQTTHLP